MMKHKWQQELENMKLSNKAKARMRERIVRPKTSSMYKFVLPTFALLTLLFIWISTSQQLPIQTNQADSGQTAIVDHTLLFKNIIWWMFTGFLLYVAFLLQAMLLPIYTKRYHHLPKVQRYITFMEKVRTNVGYMFLLIIAVVLLATFIFGTPLLFVSSALIYQVYCVTFITLNSMAALCWTIRTKVRPACPHCGETFEKKHMRKFMWAAFNMTCVHCEQKIYLTKAARRKSGYIMLFNGFFILAPSFGIPLLIILLQVALFYIFLLQYYYHYVYEFTTEDEPLW